jgi:quercetin dioxygenase-like cupin family protein
MEIIEISSITAFSSDKYNKIPINNTKGLLRLLCFEPSQRVPPHKHPNGDEYFYVIKGRGKVTVGKEEIEVESGILVRAPAGIVHQWKNGLEELVLLSVLIPPACYESADETTKMEYT